MDGRKQEIGIDRVMNLMWQDIVEYKRNERRHQKYGAEFKQVVP